MATRSLLTASLATSSHGASRDPVSPEVMESVIENWRLSPDPRDGTVPDNDQSHASHPSDEDMSIVAPTPRRASASPAHAVPSLLREASGDIPILEPIFDGSPEEEVARHEIQCIMFNDDMEDDTTDISALSGKLPSTTTSGADNLFVQSPALVDCLSPPVRSHNPQILDRKFLEEGDPMPVGAELGLLSFSPPSEGSIFNGVPHFTKCGAS